jgi:thymidylate synthase (FAD)
MKIIDSSYKIEDEVDGMALLRRIEKAGRTCYKSEALSDDSAIAFVTKIIKNGHHSVLEHEKITVRVVCDRGVTHEIVRHRLGSYSQESTRYCNYAKDRFGNEITLSPMIDKLTFEQLDRRMVLFRDMESVYLKEIEEGISPQQARDVLPTCLKTEIVMTYNVREWRHFFTLRTAKAAHPQMRKIMCPLLAEFRRLIPVAFDDVGTTEI